MVTVVLSGRSARRHSGLRGSGRIFRMLANLSNVAPSKGPTDLTPRPATPRRCCPAAASSS